MRRGLLAVGLLVIALGAIVATSAFTGGDEAVDEVYLNPAPTDEGARYASLDGNGQLQVDITGANDDAVTDFHEVFNISATGEVLVWAEYDADGVTLYRSDTGESIEGSANAIEFSPNETVPVGIRADSRSGDVSLDEVRFHATTPEDESTTPDPDEPSTETPTTETPDTDTPEERTPTVTTAPAGPGGGVIVTPDTATRTTGTPAGTPTPDGPVEVAGFPLWQLALLGLALLVLLALLGLWRFRGGEAGVTIRLPDDSPLSIAPGAIDDLEATVLEDGSAVTVSGEQIETAATAEESGTISRVVTLANGGDAAVDVGARLASGSIEGLSLLTDDLGGTDLLTGTHTIGVGESFAVSVVFAEEASSPNLDIVIETDEA